MTFVVSGEPVAQPRPRAGKNPRTGKVNVYTPKGAPVRAYRDETGWRAREAMPVGWDDSLPMRVIAEFVFPASGEPFVSREDVDNCYKAVGDGMNRIVYRDDRQVVCLTAFKRFARQGESPCTRVTVTADEGKGSDAAESAPAAR